MPFSDNLNTFIDFLNINAKELESIFNAQRRIDWKGQTTDDNSTILERFNFFSPEFAAYISNKIKDQKCYIDSNIPLNGGTLYNYNNSHVNSANTKSILFTRFQLINRSYAHSRSAFNIKFLADKDVFVTAADDGTICIWNSLNGELLEKQHCHESPINNLEYYEDERILVSSDISGVICIFHCYSGVILKYKISTGKEIDKIHLFRVGDSSRLFIAFKNGPYSIYAADHPNTELYRSGASYKESALMTGSNWSFFIVKTTSGLFSINFNRESQETWFLDEEDPHYIIPTTNGNKVIAIGTNGRVYCLIKTENDVRPVVAWEKQICYDCSDINLIQVFDTFVIFVKYFQGKSFVTIFSIEEDNFFELLLTKTFTRICYYFVVSPICADIITFATVDGNLIWLNIRTSEVIQEKRITSSINGMQYSKNGRSLSLLDENGGISFFSAGQMPLEGGPKLKLFNNTNDFELRNCEEFFRFRQKIKQDAGTVSFSKRPRDTSSIDKKKVKEAKTKAESVVEEEELDHLPYWNSLYKQQSQPYVPQMKDTVLYFPKPHFEFLKKQGRKLKERIDYEEDLPKDKMFVEGEIEEIEYIPGEVVKCKIVLKIKVGRKSNRIEFSYFFGVNQPNFMLLKSSYEDSQRNKFKLNETVKIHVPPCKGDNGIILEIKDSNLDPLTCIGAYKILCKRKENTCYYSHWEIGKLRGGTEHSIESISTEETEILTEITSKLLSEEKWTPFRYSVDFSEYPEYYASVPYPMYLELIHKRVTHKYYRSVASFFWDIRQISVDALIFNEPDSDIVNDSNELLEFVEREFKLNKLKK